MNESWYSISNINTSGSQLSANALFSAGSPWFSGHFPGEPILPGIAELSMAFDLIKKYYHNNKNLIIISLKKIRFKLLIKPEELLDIIVNPVDNSINTYSFKINAGENSACSGIITVKEPD